VKKNGAEKLLVKENFVFLLRISERTPDNHMQMWGKKGFSGSAGMIFVVKQ
jgi:hypothetical protein